MNFLAMFGPVYTRYKIKFEKAIKLLTEGIKFAGQKK